MGSRRAQQPCSPASRNDHTSSISVESWPCSKNDLPHFDSEHRAGRGSQGGLTCLLARSLARARPGQGITSAAVRKTLVLRALKTKKGSKRAVGFRLAFLLNFLLPCLAISTILLSTLPSKRASPLNGFGQQMRLAASPECHKSWLCCACSRNENNDSTAFSINAAQLMHSIA
jgi:hypothetical protein